jgi:hypothetical protein
MQRLDETHLIGADASILAFIRQAHERPLRLVVSADRVSGLISISDLQQLPVRAALFAVVTHLETLMAELIRWSFGDASSWLPLLAAARRRKIEEEIAQGHKNDVFVDPVLFTQLCDKRDILLNTEPCNAHDSSWVSDMKRIEHLRNALAHANEYASSRDAATQVCKTVHTMDHWLGRLADTLAGSSTRLN